MKNIILAVCISCFTCMHLSAQEKLQTLLFTDVAETELAKKELEKVHSYFTKMIKTGKVNSYNEAYIDENKQDRPLSLKEFEHVSEQYTYDTTMQTDPQTQLKVATVFKYNYKISKVRFVTEFNFDEKTKKMKSRITQINFLAEVRSSEGIFIGYTTRYYVKL